MALLVSKAVSWVFLVEEATVGEVHFLIENYLSAALVIQSLI